MSFFEELKRRNVVRVGVAYGIASWVLLQVADLVLEAIEAPSWVLQALMLVVALGFVVALTIVMVLGPEAEGCGFRRPCRVRVNSRARTVHRPPRRVRDADLD